MIVVDTNVIVGLVVSEDPDCIAAAARSDSLVAPVLWRSEFRSALAGYMRVRGMDIGSALQALNAAEAQITDVRFSAERHLELVTTSTCSAYDLEFVACALELEVPLVTNDRRILESFPDVAVSPAEFVAGTPPAGSSG